MINFVSFLRENLRIEKVEKKKRYCKSIYEQHTPLIPSIVTPDVNMSLG